MCYLENLQPNLHGHLISSCTFPMYYYVTHPPFINNWEHDTRMIKNCCNMHFLVQLKLIYYKIKAQHNQNVIHKNELAIKIQLMHTFKSNV
jgi:hypothetical protein